MLDVMDIFTNYGQSRILHGVSLKVDEGEVVCLLGRNGAGKSTTLKSIIGLTPPWKGSIKFKDKEIVGKKPFRIARSGIGYVPEDRRIFPNLNVLANLEMGIQSSASKKWSLDRIYEIFPMLSPLRNRKGMNLSGGEQQMLTIARTLMGDPKVILLDEPSEGLGPIIVQELGRLIREIKAEITILLVEQNANFALRLSDRGYMIEKGQIISEGTIAEIQENKEIWLKSLSV